ncbi:unnamed protein product, partial [Choristocarpus tenellus]
EQRKAGNVEVRKRGLRYEEESSHPCDLELCNHHSLSAGGLNVDPFIVAFAFFEIGVFIVPVAVYVFQIRIWSKRKRKCFDPIVFAEIGLSMCSVFFCFSVCCIS